MVCWRPDRCSLSMEKGSDMDKTTGSCIFTGEGVGFIPDIYSAEYECIFDII